MKVQWFVGDLLDMVIWSFDLVLFVSERNVLGFGIDHIRRECLCKLLVRQW